MAATNIRIAVGSDSWQSSAGAELVLQHSGDKHCTRAIDWTWMRAGDRDWPVSEDGRDGSWKLGRPVHLAWPKRGWGTPFSGFRFAIPELFEFSGRAIYLDADQLILGDIAELWHHPMRKGIACCHPSRTDVAVIDCAWFKDKPWWPRIKDMKKSGFRVFEYLQILQQHSAIDVSIPWSWNDIDGVSYAKRPEDTKLVHFSSVPQQPYRPYLETPYEPIYPFCKNRAAGELWWDTYREALNKTVGPVEAERIMWKATH